MWTPSNIKEKEAWLPSGIRAKEKVKAGASQPKVPSGSGTTLKLYLLGSSLKPFLLKEGQSVSPLSTLNPDKAQSLKPFQSLHSALIRLGGALGNSLREGGEESWPS